MLPKSQKSCHFRRQILSIARRKWVHSEAEPSAILRPAEDLSEERAVS